MFKRVIKEELRVPAEIGYLGDLRDFITRVGRKYGLTENVINAFKLAIDEAGTNVVRHAYRDWAGFITMRMIIREKDVTVSLVDQGHTFDPRNVSDPDLQRYVDIGKKGGLGVFIIRRVIDEIEYRKTEEGNELLLTKRREVVPKKYPLLPEMSLSMKVRYFLIATSVLSPAVILVFIITYSGIARSIMKNDLAAGWVLARSVTNQSMEALAQERDYELATIASEFKRNHSPHVYDAVIVDTLGIIQGSAETEKMLSRFDTPPDKLRIEEFAFEYRIDGGKRVIDLANPAIEKATNKRLGMVHLLLDREVIAESIREEKRSTLLLYLMVLLIGNVGVAILIYVTMSPFKRLAAWVRELGQGGASDEMEFDSSDEIGEIALAFNEITEKFRKSQVDLAEQERLQKEMQVAQEIQQTLLPDKFPDIEGFEIASYYEAAKEVGGDYYDFVEVDNDTLGIVVADVSGKGVPGSLVMTMIRTALRTEARGNKDAADVLARVNDFVMCDMKRGMFVTVFYLILDSKTRTINYASAGHNPMILFRSKTKKSYYLNPRGFPIGINLPEKSLFRKSIESDMLRLQKGDVLLLYTDGITEAMNPRREQFGDERFLEAIRQYGEETITEQVDKLHNRIEAFTEGYAQNDDITLVAIREKMKAEDVLYNHWVRLMKMVEDGSTVKAACKHFGVSTSTYYKYKKLYKKEGKKGIKESVSRSDVEEKHVSIEDKAKIFDIIRNNPDFGPKRISDELNTETYEFTVLDEKVIYEELVRSRLNTKELRQAFIERGKSKKRFKPPGTPFLTLSGEVIVTHERAPAVKPYPRQTEAEAEEIAAEEVASSITPSGGAVLSEETILPHDFAGDDFSEDFGEPADGEDEHVISGARIEELFGEDGDGDDEEFLDLTEMSGEVVTRELEKKHRRADTSAEAYSEAGTGERGEDEYAGDHEYGDDMLDILISDVSELEAGDDDVRDHAERISLDEVLAVDEGNFPIIENEDQVEEGISSSIAGDLLADEILAGSRSDNLPYGLDFEMLDDPDALDDLFADDRGPGTRDPHLAAKSSEQFQSGLGFYKDGQYKEAIDEFMNIIKVNPKHGSAFQYLGDAYFRIGELENAIKAYENARTLQPENMNILENMGVIFANMGDFKKAVWQWGEVLKNDPERKDIIDRIKKMQRIIRQRYQ
ncbi:SpoIIE family protein phosphatase [bacterium]|nr:SpoIIE family protein phosphatase [bacterium]